MRGILHCNGPRGSANCCNCSAIAIAAIAICFAVPLIVGIQGKRQSQGRSLEAVEANINSRFPAWQQGGKRDLKVTGHPRINQRYKR
jgi:hypothetical protein